MLTRDMLIKWTQVNSDRISLNLQSLPTKTTLSPEDILLLLTYIKEKGINQLWMAHLTNGDQVAIAISDVLTLKNLSLNQCHITSVGAAALAKLPLFELGLCDNLIRDVGLAALAPMMVSLKRLYVTDCGISSEGVIFLANQPNTLNILNLSNNPIGDIEGCEALGKIKTLQILLANNCLIEEPGAAALGQSGLPLLSLELDDNSIGDRGLVALTQLHTLTGLSVNRCGITNSGALSLAQSLLRDSLLELDIEGNQISNPGAIALSGMLHLLRLSISANPIGDTGAVALLTNITLSYLGFELDSTKKMTTTGKHIFRSIKRHDNPCMRVSFSPLGSVHREALTLRRLCFFTLDRELPVPIEPAPDGFVPKDESVRPPDSP